VVCDQGFTGLCWSLLLIGMYCTVWIYFHWFIVVMSQGQVSFYQTEIVSKTMCGSCLLFHYTWVIVIILWPIRAYRVVISRVVVSFNSSLIFNWLWHGILYTEFVSNILICMSISYCRIVYYEMYNTCNLSWVVLYRSFYNEIKVLLKWNLWASY
jgi:hypothetical protein